ncbi:hypothetical protein COV49_00285 [Candidatus Falkowbacteria bacterium CG11_big_fil_rev_8_21_14_0_20_39_10]|uniref:DUF11 domain-containing protein n=1 Tax=Candidatus Falkowbacteria bacterium CG11_big_fil_rev_8_21_14_0_20_39_10 TaxID=1974570 RepID=A0A2M6KAD1_9BACT|nr:MAG: hypothetical protein COV49_00285 [Candidatus Falkowbacteria bacterium CG11_big_fil_rev_8_21_14_0_20_39_10]
MKNNLIINKEFNKDDHGQADNKGRGYEIIKKDKDDAVIVSKEGLDVKKGGNIIIGTLNVLASPLKRRHAKHYKDSKFHFAADIIFVLIILGLAFGVYWLRGYIPNRDIYLESSYLSQKIISGRVETFEIVYNNKSEKVLENSILAINLPKNFSLENSVPENIFNKNSNTFALGDLPGGANGKIKITGLVLGEVGNQQALSLILSYKQNGRSRSTLNSLIYNIEGSVLNIELFVPEKVYQGVEFSGKIGLKNQDEKDLDNIELSLNQDIWQLKNIIKIDKIKANTSEEIDFIAINNKEEGSYDFGLSCYLLINNKKLKQSWVDKRITVQKPRFDVSVNTDQEIIKDGEKALFKIVYKNNEEVEVGDVKLSFYSGNKNYEINNFSVVNSSPENSTIGKDSLSVNDLSPGQGGQIDIQANFQKNAKEINQEVYLSAVVDYFFDGQNIKRPINSNRVKVLSNLKIKSAGYYYSPQGDQLGVGPLPPVVDMPTNYWIFWEVENFGNDLENLIVTAQLPENVVWTDSKSLQTGNIQFAQVSRRVIWEVGRIDKISSSNKVGFEVGLIPTKDDVGKVLDLLADIKYSVKDSFCDQEIGGVLANINTNLSFDKLASGRGAVLP